jgi:tetratricopeptide (TPR) repeat protein
MNRQRRLLLASLLAVWVGMVIACGGGSHPNQQSPAPAAEKKLAGKEARPKREQETREDEAKKRAREAIHVSAEDLIAQYKANEVSADQAYKGRWLEVRGTVDKVGKDLLDTMYVTLKSGQQFDFVSVQCFFEKEWENALASVKPNYIYKIRGQCDGKFANVLLRKCEFVTRKEEESVAQEAADEARANREQVAREKAEEEKKRAEENAPEDLNVARGSLDAGKASQAKGNYREATRLFQKAIGRGQQIIDKAPETKEAGEAKKLVAEAKKLVAEAKGSQDRAKAEQEAASNLKLAKMLEADGLKDKAHARYQEIVKRYPKTKAAQEARELLDK